MTIDLREDYPVVYGHIVQRVAGYDRKKNAGPGKAGDPVAAITCGYDHDQGGWVALVFDTRPGAEADGEWTNYIGDVSIAFPHWAAASDVLYDQGKSVNLILMDGSTQEILPESEEAVMGPCIGEVLRQAMLAARDNGVLQRLPLADHCLMGVEHLEGEYAWPIFENREDGLVK